LETQYIGDDFVKEKNAAVLKVPSSIVKQEFNYLINPNHTDAEKISVISVTPFKFDSRMQQPKKKE
jgi:RES domain-containing protein